jgi:hypothetical protein
VLSNLLIVYILILKIDSSNKNNKIRRINFRLINKKTITNYVKAITNPNTRKTYRLSLNKFYSYLQDDNITDINRKTLTKLYITANYT